MSDVIQARFKLRDYADELDKISRDLASVQRQFEPVDREVQSFLADFELGLFHKSVNEDFKLPAEKIREKLARQALPPELYGKHLALKSSIDRMTTRISTLKSLVEAQRSILSASKLEMEATG